MQNVRRIVTGWDAEGRSTIVLDAEAGNYTDHSPGVRTTEIWETGRALADAAATSGVEHRQFTLEPPDAGTIFRYVEFAPGEGVDEPFMHMTNTVDYIVIIEGEIYCVMEEGEVLMKAGDALVQRGTRHAWVNRSESPCLLASVLISAAPEEGVR